MNKKIVILGAGITGLTAAYALSKKGYKVTVFEKSKEVGGLATSYIDKEGCVYDYGPHEFCTENKELIKILKEILGKDLLIRKKKASQYFFNKYIPYPLKPIDFLTKLPLHLSITVFFEVLFAKIKQYYNPSLDYSFKSWTKSRFGNTLYDKYFGPYTTKVWGINPDELDLSTASSRIGFNSIFDLLFKTVQHYITKKDNFSTIHNPLKDSFYYSKGGNIKLIQSLYKRCSKENVKFKMGFKATKITIKNSKAIKINFSNKKSISNFDYIINTTPLTSLTKMINKRNNFPLRFRSMIFGFISFNQSELSPYSWIYTPSKELIFQRITEFKNLNADMCPKNKTNIAVEISCFKKDKIWKTSDEDIIQKIIRDLKKMKLLKGNEEYSGYIKKQEYAYPLQIRGFQTMIEEIIIKDIQPIKKLVTIGRQGLFKYCNQNECMEMALNTVNQIINNTTKFNYNFEDKWKGAGFKEERILKKEKINS